MSKITSAKPAGDQEPRIGVYVCHCGLNIAQSVDCKRVAESVENKDGVVLSKDIVYACSEPGQQKIKQDIIDNGLDRGGHCFLFPASARSDLQEDGRVGRA